MVIAGYNPNTTMLVNNDKAIIISMNGGTHAQGTSPVTSLETSLETSLATSLAPVLATSLSNSLSNIDDSKSILVIDEYIKISDPNKITQLNSNHIKALKKLGLEKAEPKLQKEILIALYTETCTTYNSISSFKQCEPIRKIVQTLALKMLSTLRAKSVHNATELWNEAKKDVEEYDNKKKELNKKVVTLQEEEVDARHIYDILNTSEKKNEEERLMSDTAKEIWKECTNALKETKNELNEVDEKYKKALDTQLKAIKDYNIAITESKRIKDKEEEEKKGYQTQKDEKERKRKYDLDNPIITLLAKVKDPELKRLFDDYENISNNDIEQITEFENFKLYILLNKLKKMKTNYKLQSIIDKMPTLAKEKINNLLSIPQFRDIMKSI